MDVVYKMSEWGASLFDAAAVIAFLTIVLKRNDRIKNITVYSMIMLAFVAGLGFLQDISENAGITLLCIFTGSFVFSLFFLQGSWKSKFLYNLIFYVIQMTSNMLIVYGITTVLKVELEKLTEMGSTIRILTLILHKMLFLLMLMVIILLCRRKKAVWQEWLIGGLLYGGALLTGCVVVNITKTGRLTEKEETELIFVAFGLLAICAAVSLCLYYLNRQQQYKLENEILIMKLQEEKNTLNKLDEVYENNRILRHDLKHYLTVVRGMLYTSGVEETTKYLEELLQSKFERDLYYYTDSTVVNAVLNDKVSLCKKNNISCNIEICGQIGEERQTDIGIILSNHLDNAIEAELKEKERYISVEITRQKRNLFIKVENSVSEPVFHNNPSLRTIKKDTNNHGIGIKSVRKLVQGMDGFCLWEDYENRFSVTVMLPEHANRA